MAWDWATAAAWMFIIGSFCFVAAGLYNALNIHHDRSNDGKYFYELTPYNVSVATLFCGIFGTVLFVVGSFYFRPGGVIQCDDGKIGRWCHCSTFTGAWCFIIGSILFVAQSVLGLLSAVITHRSLNIAFDESSADEDADSTVTCDRE
ncbi:unnamed protein product [Prorocentrum cordatum]|uniref:YrhK domain-containing protein n=1 Tax=Prorocentrum cordatum TaxID=2364126 RepID=A0ABN9QA66_9DINO|nr:unnamed protein product [Polarella glacialis]